MANKAFALLALAICVSHAAPAVALDLNSFRRANGLKPLAASAVLSARAREHAADMARRGSMDHAGFYARLRGVGPFAAENVATGCPTADCAYKMWTESSGHRANMLNSHVTHYGLASAKSADGQRYWALELATIAPPPRRHARDDGSYIHLWINGFPVR